jgi:hypothetical protein
MSDKEDNKLPPPAFNPSSNMDRYGISLDNDDDIGHEETRRVGGGFNPSFAPNNISFEPPPMMAPMSHTAFGGPASGMFSTASNKAQTQAFSRPAKFQWLLPDAPTLPEFHPLERTAVFVPNTDASTVSGRISDVLRDRSIEASFDDTKGRARCVSADGVDFRVRLYRGRGQYKHGIIVEVQRRFGTSINFHSDTKAILDSAEGKTPSPPPTKPATLPLGPQEDNYKPSAGSSLGMVSRMLNFPGYDSQYLALQTLTSLTDPAKMGFATAKSVSTELMNSNTNDVGGKLLMLILSSPKNQEETFDLRVMAMNVLANVLNVVSGDIPESIKMQLRPVMKQDLRRAESNPRLATIAARCIEHLIDNDRSASDIYHDALEAAYQVGNDRHAGLMRQAERCLQKIGAR